MDEYQHTQQQEACKFDYDSIIKKYDFGTTVHIDHPHKEDEKISVSFKKEPVPAEVDKLLRKMHQVHFKHLENVKSVNQDYVIKSIKK